MKNKKQYSLLPYVKEDIYGNPFLSGDNYGWELTKLNVPDSWSSSMGENVVVAVIDTGCDLEHNDLRDNLLDGKNFVENNNYPVDRNGHGSHVAGTVAGSLNGKGIVGVAPKAKIIPIKSLNDEGYGASKDIANGIVWAVDRSVDFITMSLGSAQESKDIKNAIFYAVSKGVVIFCAAGNEGEHHSIMYPAKYNEVISIGAIDERLDRTDFTCSGNELDFLAPGHNIISCAPGNRYSMMSGTSMSNPFAVGCASLYLSFIRKQGGKEPKTSNEYIDIFKRSAIHLSNPRYSHKKEYEGYGIITPVF